jgi:hypothetical protein
MSNLKRVSGMFAAATLAWLGLAGCGGGGSASTDPARYVTVGTGGLI